jgi:hypothetical protein
MPRPFLLNPISSLFRPDFLEHPTLLTQHQMTRAARPVILFSITNW